MVLECAVIEPGAWGKQTDGRTDKRIAASLNAPYRRAGGETAHSLLSPSLSGRLLMLLSVWSLGWPADHGRHRRGVDATLCPDSGETVSPKNRSMPVKRQRFCPHKNVTHCSFKIYHFCLGFLSSIVCLIFSNFEKQVNIKVSIRKIFFWLQRCGVTVNFMYIAYFY